MLLLKNKLVQLRFKCSIAAKEKENAALRLEIEKKDSTIKSLNSIVSGFQALNIVETDEYAFSKGKTK